MTFYNQSYDHWKTTEPDEPWAREEYEQMNIDTEFPSGGEYLTTKDIPPNKRVSVTIGGVIAVEFDEEKFPALTFVGKDKKMKLNATNKRILRALYGPETEEWIGKEVKVWHDPTVAFAGNTVGGLRIVVDAPAEDEELPF